MLRNQRTCILSWILRRYVYLTFFLTWHLLILNSNTVSLVLISFSFLRDWTSFVQGSQGNFIIFWFHFDLRLCTHLVKSIYEIFRRNQRFYINSFAKNRLLLLILSVSLFRLVQTWAKSELSSTHFLQIAF